MRLLIGFVFMFSAFISYAQPTGGLYNSGANIVLTSGTYVYIDGDNSGDYYTTSNGEIDVKTGSELIIEGDWHNNNGSDNAVTSTSENGWVRFENNGSGAQTITGDAATTFTYLEFNNNNGITLAQDAGTAGQLEITDGVVTTGANKLIMTSTTASDLIAFSSTDFVFGTFRRHFAANASTYIFPVADGTAGTNYKRADLVNSSLNLSGGTDYVDVSVASITEGGSQTDATFLAAGETCLGTPLEEIHSGAIWDITPSNATVSSGTYGVNLYLQNVGDGLTDNSKDNMFTVVKTNDVSNYGNWASVACAQGSSIPNNGAAGRIWNGGAGYAQKLTFNSFSKFALASASAVLPVELTSFDVQCEDKEVYLNWTTASERNSDFFTVQRSTENGSFESIAIVEAAGNSSEELNYEFTDMQSQRGAQYQLQLTNIDGTTEVVSVIETSSCTEDILGVGVSLFHANGIINVNVANNSANEKFNFKLIDVTGKVVVAQTAQNVSSFQVNSGSIATGTYVAMVVGDQSTFHSQKLIIQ